MRRFGVTAVACALAAVVAFVLLLPASGVDTEPLEGFSTFGYVVPCGLGPEQSHGEAFAVSGAALSAALVGIRSAVGRWECTRKDRETVG